MTTAKFDVSNMITPSIQLLSNTTVSQWDCGRYFMWHNGDELLLESTNDNDAIVEANNLLLELEST